MTAALDDTETAAIVTRLHEVNARIDELNATAEDLKQLLRAHLADGTYTMHGQPVLRISAQRRLDVDKAIEMVPAPLRAQCQTTSYDAKKIKALLAPVQVETCMVAVGLPRVTLL